MKKILNFVVLFLFMLSLCISTSCSAEIIDKPVERIVSGYYISSSVCIALGLADEMVGIEARADTRPVYGVAAPQLLDLPNVGTARDFNLEACLALEPDLVILPNRLRDVADTLTEMGIYVILVDPEGYDEIIDMIEQIGKATNTESRAGQLIAWYTQALEDLNTLTAGIQNKPHVYISGVSSWLTTAPKDMYQSFLVEAAGGQNAASVLDGRGWVDISYEQLLSMNPEIIIIPSEAGYDIGDIISDTALSQLSAVKNKTVYKMPYTYEAWDSPVPASMLGAFWMLGIFHGDLMHSIDVNQASADFYSEFYGIK